MSKSIRVGAVNTATIVTNGGLTVRIIRITAITITAGSNKKGRLASAFEVDSEG